MTTFVAPAICVHRQDDCRRQPRKDPPQPRPRALQDLGEVTIVVGGLVADSDETSGTAEEAGGFDEAAALEVLRAAGLSLKDASAAIAKLTGTRRREVYQRGLRR